MLTWSRIPIPVKIAVEGGNICGKERQEGIRRPDIWKVTGPVKVLRNPEKA